jgi:hypothetical protein
MFVSSSDYMQHLKINPNLYFRMTRKNEDASVEEKRRFAHLFILDGMSRCQRSKQKPHHYEPNYGHGK